MKHIKEEYGSQANLLELTNEELEQLEPFLNALGIRVRSTMWSRDGLTIQAENPYKAWIPAREREYADKEMTPDELRAYRR